MGSFDHVFSPLRIKTLQLKNRLVMPPMHTSFGAEDGTVTTRLIDYYVARAEGGVGLIVQEATGIRPEGAAMRRWLGVSDDSFLPGLRQLVDAVHAGGGKIAIQLHHAGRATSSAVIGQQPVAPSAVNCQVYPEMPRPLSVPEIIAIEDAFAQAAERAVAAGYDAIELHGAHGYLINQFLSPLTNRREDEYGGNAEGRLRFACNVIRKVRRAVGPDYPVSVRINTDEYLPGGLTLTDSRVIVPQLVAAGLDFVHVAAAGPSAKASCIHVAPMGTPRGHLVHLAAGIKQVVDVPVITVGRIVDVAQAEEILRSGKADLVAMGRALIADPELPNKAQQAREKDIRPCIGCHQGCRVFPISCLGNVAAGRERELQLTPASRAKKVVVVGGGPAGLEMARVAALRGDQITLFEQEDALGGRLRAGAVAPHKQELAGIVNYLERQVRALGVSLCLGQEATSDVIRELGPDDVVIATGGQPVVPALPGVDRSNVVVAEDVLLRNVPVGQTAIVMGAGMTGCEVAEFLAAKGKRVTIVTRIPRVEEIAADVSPSPRFLLMGRLRDLQVEILTGTTLEEVRQAEVIVRHGNERTVLAADTVVLAQGYRPNRDLADQLRSSGMAVRIIGDAAESRTAKEAIREGSEIARQI